MFVSVLKGKKSGIQYIVETCSASEYDVFPKALVAERLNCGESVRFVAGKNLELLKQCG
jgi:hypothetical protein